MARSRAFAMVELVVVIAIAAVLLALCLLAIERNRRQASVRGDVSRLRLIGQASAIYSADFQDRLFTFSWRPGEVPVTPNAQLAAACAQLPGTSGGDDQHAAVLQHLDLVSQLTDLRLIQPTPSLAATDFTPYVRYSHLVLAYYVGEPLPSEVFISQADAHRNAWVADPESYLLDPQGGAYRPPTTASRFEDLWRWALSSSFQIGASHYAPDFGPPRTVSRIVNNALWRMPTDPGLLGRRSMSEVAIPSAKVMMFDEYDRYTGPHGQYFGLRTARSIVSFYDGHVQRLPTRESDFGFDPNQPWVGSTKPDAPSVYYQCQPIKGWDPYGSQSQRVPVYYDQTRDGLQGVDYPQYANRRPIVSP